jgi:hypothetical protein
MHKPEPHQNDCQRQPNQIEDCFHVRVQFYTVDLFAKLKG